MAKKKKAPRAPAPQPRRAFDPESSPYFVPIAFVVIFITLVILFSDFLFSDKMLYGSDTIQAGIFFRNFLVEYVKEHGAVPQWNPYIFCGMPYVEAFHGDIFYPLSVLKFFGTLYRMLGINLFLHILLAGLFMYFTARQFKLSRTASLMSGVSYMFAGYLVSLVAPGHDGKIYVATLFPPVVLFLDRMFETRPFLNASLLGLVLGIIILSPHPQMSYFTLWAVAFYTVYRLVLLFREETSIMPLVRPAVLAAYAVAVGLLISAIQFYPGYVYTSEFSPRAEAKSGWDWATSWSLHEEEAFSLLVPEFCGASSKEATTHYWGKNNFKDNSETVGIVTVFVGLIGLFFSRRRGRWFFGGLAIFALLYALGATTPVFRLFYYLIPKVKSLRAPSMIMFLFSFSGALLAGFGLQQVIEWQRSNKRMLSQRFTYVLWGLPGLMLFLALLFSAAGRGMISLWTSLFFSNASSLFIRQGVSKLDLAYLNLPAIQSGAWLGFLFTALAALFIWMYSNRKTGAAALLGLLLIPVIDGARFNSRFISTFDPDQVWSENALTRFLKQQEGHNRVHSFSMALQQDVLPYHAIEVVVGYHGNQLRWYDELLGGLGSPNETNPRLLNLAGAEYLLVPSEWQLPEDALGEKPVTVAATFGQLQIIQNDNAFPRVYLVERYQVYSDRGQIHSEVLNGSQDLSRIVLLEREPGLEIAGDTASVSTDSARIIDYAIDSVLVGLSCSRNQLLVMTDNYYDAWHVTVDGQPAELLRAYGSFRAVAVPAGTKRVLFRYDSARYRLGRTVTWLTVLYLAVIFGGYVVRSKVKKPLAKGSG